MIGRALIVVLAFVAACRGSVPSSPDDQPADFLVWSAHDDRPETRWLDADGRELGRLAGIHVAAGGTLWRLDRAAHDTATRGCRDDDAGQRVPGSASLTDLSASSADRRTRLVIVRPEPAAIAEYERYDHRVVVRASLGPLVFGEERVDEDACGAHGGVDASAFRFELDTHTRHAVAARIAPGQLGPRIRAAFEREAIEGLEIDSPSKIAETIPVWTDGALGARHLVFVDTCYACGNGAWASYTSAVWIDDVRIPDEWAFATEVTPAIAALIGSPGPVPTGVSWGTPDAAWREAFARKPDPPAPRGLGG